MDRARPRAVRGASVSSFSDSDASGESSDEGRPIRIARAAHSNTSTSDNSPPETDTDDDGNESQSEVEDEELDPATQAKYLSFGALASAQASILGKRTRDQSSSTHQNSHNKDDKHDQEEKDHPKPAAQKKTNSSDRKPPGPHQRPQIPARSSKHAPTELSSKKAVSRKRPVISDSNTGNNNSNSNSNNTKPRARDPRFHSVSGPLNHAQVEANYAFLSDYRADELSTLRAALKTKPKPTPKTTPTPTGPQPPQKHPPQDPTTLLLLQSELRRRESQAASARARAAERSVHAAHRRAERAKVARGKKPFYLKASAARRAVLAERFQAATPRERERMVERRRKKTVARERKRDVVPGPRRRRSSG